MSAGNVELVASSDLSVRAWSTLVAIFLVPTAAFAVLLFLLTKSNGRALAQMFGLANARISLAMVGALAFAYCSGATGIWPWAWDVPESQSAALATQLVGNDLYVPIVFYLLVSAVCIPVVEEFIFRFGLTNYLYRKSSSAFFAITISSVLFGAMHVGNVAAMTAGAIQPFIGATLLGGITSFCTLRDGGRIGRAIIWHGLRNGVEAAVLFYSASHVRR